MDVTIRHNPSFAVARCTLAGGESMRAESGAMYATSGGVEIEAKVQGGLMKGLKRSMLGGESLFMTTLTAPGSGGWVDVAARLPGDVIVLPVGAGLNMTRGSYLASTSDVEIDTKWGGVQGPHRRGGRVPDPRQRRAGRGRRVPTARSTRSRSQRASRS